MRTKLALVCVTACLLGAIAYAAQQVPDGFTFREIRFDESTGEKKPTPIIPKEWKLVGVANGDAINSNNLWFQDASGNLYMVNGFLARGDNDPTFILKPNIHTLSRK